MINSIQCHCVSCFADLAINRDRYPHAQPIGLNGVIGNIGSLVAPITLVAYGISVPIIRGRPPTLIMI